MDVFDENTRSGAVVAACEHARRDERAKESWVRYLTRRVDPDVLAEVVDRLATPEMNLAVAIEADSGIEGAHVAVRVGD
ncbi:hypothetical protein [Halanaeroarchaeum sulfurireducens]|uniref:Uncharacterized protein n=1 Tax=Halanaeroarchaeum sulfurireducens TaxID=1604004 RepID=A0A0F7P6Z5_9EURY|nr:hypothetical protein [Halanaeroarchaeum sulfurireducens]AKH96971.1 hypothetical protein HLASF_0466 [Halanaeroarchaeum sulfurireducens]ALG81372.1 hypothetical protein HLASA_0464 [Halanaeroarchaeum sulfurireducens]